MAHSWIVGIFNVKRSNYRSYQGGSDRGGYKDRKNTHKMADRERSRPPPKYLIFYVNHKQIMKKLKIFNFLSNLASKFYDGFRKF